MFKVFTFLKNPTYQKGIVLQLLHFDYWKKYDFPIFQLLQNQPILLNEEIGESSLSSLSKQLSYTQKNVRLEVVRRTFQLTSLSSGLIKNFETNFSETTNKCKCLIVIPRYYISYLKIPFLTHS